MDQSYASGRTYRGIALSIGLLLASAAIPDSAFAQSRGFGSLADVKPGDWAYTALNSLAQRHKCLPGTSNRLGGRAVSRYEFAVSLSTCLDAVDEKARRPGQVAANDLRTAQRLRFEFSGELAALRASANDEVRFPIAISRLDYGGGGKLGYMLYKSDPIVFIGRNHTGHVTSRIEPIRFDDGRGRITFYGQFNNGFVNVDNGNGNGNGGSHSYFATNGASQNFLGVNVRYDLDGGWRLGSRLAFSAAWNRSDFHSEANDAGCDRRHLDRKACVYDANLFLRNRTFGSFTLGYGETAFSGIGNISLGGIAHVTNNDPTVRAGWHDVIGLGRSLGDIAPDVTGVTRAAMLRYDSPTFAGFVVSGSFGEANHTGAPHDAEDYWDVALRYAGEFAGFKVAAGVGYQDYKREGGSDLRQNNFTVGGSILHVPTGLFASGSLSSIGRDAPFTPGPAETDRASAFYIQAGIVQNFFPIGRTTFFTEYGETTDGATAGAYFVRDSETTNWGFGVVQNIDAFATSLYLTYNRIDAKIGDSTGQDIDVVMGGARVKF